MSLSKHLDQTKNHHSPHGTSLLYLLSSYFPSSETESTANEEKTKEQTFYAKGSTVTNNNAESKINLGKNNKQICPTKNKCLPEIDKRSDNCQISIIDVLGCYLESGNYNTDIRRSVQYLQNSNKFKEKHPNSSKISRKKVVYVDRRKTELQINATNLKVKNNDHLCVVMEINL